jgi:hypothetical protein
MTRRFDVKDSEMRNLSFSVKVEQKLRIVVVEKQIGCFWLFLVLFSAF